MKTMFKSILLLTFLFTVSISWTQTGWKAIGPYNGTIFTLVQSPSRESVLYAGCYFGGVYKSENYGETWRHLASDFSQKSVFSITIDPDNNSTIYIGTYQAGIYCSNDGGNTWRSCNTGLADLNVQDVAINPQDPNQLIASTTTGFYISQDKGSNWKILDGDVIAKKVLYDSTNENTIYCGTIDKGLRISRDLGLTWKTTQPEIENFQINNITFDPEQKSILISATRGVFKYNILEDTWEDISYSLIDSNIYEIHFAPFYKQYIACTDNGLYGITGFAGTSDWSRIAELRARSLISYKNFGFLQAAPLWGSIRGSGDFGQSWISMTFGIQNLFIGALGALNVKNYTTVICAGNEEGVSITNENWVAGDLQGWVEDDNLNEAVFSMVAHPEEEGVLFAGTERSGVYKSSNWGKNWEYKSKGIVPNQIYALSQSALEPYTLYAGTTAGLFVSDNQGQKWRLATTVGIPSNVMAISSDPTLPGVTYFSGDSGVVYVTYDNCKTYTTAQLGLPNEYITKLKAGGWGKAYALTDSGALYMTVNLGKNWGLKSQNITEPVLSIDYDHQKNWILYAGTSGGGIYKSMSEGTEWEKLTVPASVPYIFSIKVDPANADVIFGGSRGKIIKSVDRGSTWEILYDKFEENILQISIDDTDSSIIYISLENKGIYKSINGGLSWTYLSGRMNFQQNQTPFVINSRDKNQIIAGTRIGGVVTTTDEGATWQDYNHGLSLFIRSMTHDSSLKGVMYASSINNGLFKSIDYGENWFNTGLGHTNLFDIAVDPKDSQNLYAASATGIVVSNDGGHSWTDYGQKSSYIFDMVLSDGNIYLGSTGGVLIRSQDQGKTWEKLSRGLPLWTILAIAVNPSNKDMFISVEKQGIYRSTDGGVNWTKTNNQVIGEKIVRSLYFDKNGKTLFAASDGGGIYKTSNSGETWLTVNNGLTGELAYPEIIGDPSSDSIFYIAAYKDGVYKTTNGGQEWLASSTGIPKDTHVYALEIDSANPATLWAGTENGIYKSVNSGLHWIFTSTGIGTKEISEISCSPYNNSIVYAFAKGSGLYKSTDGGVNWGLVNDACNSTVVTKITFGSSSNIVNCVSSSLGFFKSQDGGITWTKPVNSSLVEPMTLGVKVNPVNTKMIYAAVSGSGVIQSNDGGVTWRNCIDDYENTHALSLVIDQVEPNRVYVGTDKGILYTVNNGDTWDYLNEGLFNPAVTSILIDPLNNKTLYAGTEGGGVFKINLP